MDKDVFNLLVRKSKVNDEKKKFTSRMSLMSAIRRRRKRRNSLKVNYCINLRAKTRKREKVFIEFLFLPLLYQMRILLRETE